MKRTFVFNKNQKTLKEKEVIEIIDNFDNHKRSIGVNRRNAVKVAEINGEEINIKSFKIPNLINQIAYNFFRKSKAERSYRYAHRLLKCGIQTPLPISYLNETKLFLYKKGFYVSKQIPYDLSYRKLISQPDYKDREAILRAFTRFTFKLHENNINFLDHSPGNTLIQVNPDGGFNFFLIDLNRMVFHKMNFEDRMKNFAKLSPKDDMLEIMCDEYAKLYTSKSKTEILKTMSHFSHLFSTAYIRKERFKKKYFFWRNR